jgi:hypothetical protein
MDDLPVSVAARLVPEARGNGDQSTPWHVSFRHYMTG